MPIGGPRPRYDRKDIEKLLEKVLADIGPERFSGMKLLHLENLVRTYQPDLPGKTLVREVINSFRSARWESCRPKKMDRWTR